MKKALIFSVFLFWVVTVGFTQTGKLQVFYQQNLFSSGQADKTGILVLDKTHSLYYCNRSAVESKELVNESDTEMFVQIRDKEGICYYTNFPLKQLISRSYIPGDEFVVLIEDNVNIEWQVSNELKKVGNFICRKATTQYKGRNWTAWFTEEIPVPAGPWKLHGLPGLIVEAEDETRTFYFYLEKLNKADDAVVIKPPQNGTKIRGWINYCEYVLKKLENLRRYLETYDGLSVRISLDDNIEKIKN